MSGFFRGGRVAQRLDRCLGWCSPSRRRPAVTSPLAICRRPRASSTRRQEEFFEAKVRPVLAAHCLECHGAEKHKGGCGSTSRDAMLKGGETGPAVVPGKPDESPLIEAIRYEGDVQMPPKGKLKDEEIAALTDWVKRGAPWPEPRPASVPDRSQTVASTSIRERPTPPVVSAQDRAFWSFQPVRNPAPPPVKDKALAAFADRSVHPRQARGERAGARAAGRQADPDPPRLPST